MSVHVKTTFHYHDFKEVSFHLRYISYRILKRGKDDKRRSFEYNQSRFGVFLKRDVKYGG